MKLGKDLTPYEIEYYIKEYEEWEKTEKGKKDKDTFEKIHEILSDKNNDCLNREQLIEVARWKTERASKIAEENPNDVVQDITRLALKLFSQEDKEEDVEEYKFEFSVL